jgi:hypothetical protein
MRVVLLCLLQATGSAGQRPLSGEVLGKNGPIAGAEVTCRWIPNADRLRLLPELPLEVREIQTRSGAEGRFRFELEPGIRHEATARARDGADELVSVPQRGVMAGDYVRLTMVKAAAIEVLASRGQVGVKAVLVRADPETLRSEILGQATAEEGRELRFSGLPPGRIRLLALRGRGEVLDKLLVLSPGERHVVEEGWLTGATLSGRVLDQNARPIGGARVRLPDLPLVATESDGAGRFTLSGIPAGEYLWRIEFEARGFQTKVRWWRPTRPGEELGAEEVLARGETREVLCTRAGKPVEGAWLVVFARRPNGSLETASSRVVRTGPDGRALLEGLPPGAKALVVIAGREGCDVVKDVGPGDDAQSPLIVELPSPASVELTLRGPLGPIAGARVRLAPRDTAPAHELLTQELFTDRRGRVRFDGIRPGTLDLSVESPPFAPLSRVLSVGPGGRQQLEQTMEPGSLIRGIVVDEEGRPAEGAIVLARQLGVHEGVGELTRATDASGRFVFEGLPEGLFRLFASRVRGSQTESCLVRPVEPGPDEVRMRLVLEDPRAGK